LRKKPLLRKVDLQMLYDYPSVRALASAVSDLSEASDSEDEEPLQKKAGESMLEDFRQVMAVSPHAICLEEGCFSATYGQIFQLALTYQRMLRSGTAGLPSGAGKEVVVLCMSSFRELLAGMLGSLLEGYAFCILGPAGSKDMEDVEEMRRQIRTVAPLAVLSGIGLDALEGQRHDPVPAWIDVSHVASQQVRRPLKPRVVGGVACAVMLSPKTESGDYKLTYVEHAALKRSVETWRKELCLEPGCRYFSTLPAYGAGLAALWSGLAAASTLVVPGAHTRPGQSLPQQLLGKRATVLSCKASELCAAGASTTCEDVHMKDLRTVCMLKDLDTTQVGLQVSLSSNVRLRVLSSDGHSLASPSSFMSLGMELHGPPSVQRAPSKQSIASSLGGYILSLSVEKRDHWGASAWPHLCSVVQGLIIFSQPLFVAARLLVGERVLLPLALVMPLPISLAVLVGLLVLEQFLRFGVVFLVKWILIGRYVPGRHDIYSLMYLRHWIVEQLAKGTILGQSAHQGSSLAFLFVRNLALKAMGAEISATCVLTGRLVGYDLIKIGELATVHGPKHVSAITYGDRSMRLNTLEVGAGAYVGPGSILQPGCKISAGAYVEPLSSVRGCVSGRVSGVPATEVAHLDAGRLPGPEEVDSFMRWAASFATGYWLLMLPQAVLPLVVVMLLKELAADPSGAPVDPENNHFGSLPPRLVDNLGWLPLVAFAASMGSTIFQLGSTILVCRILPKVKPPCSFSLASLRAQIAALKMSMVLKSAEMLADASIVPAFVRLCGATVGHGCAMGLQVMLPECLVVGEKCFFATGNILTSVDLDRGRFNVPHVTEMADHTFLGNHNHLPQGLPEGCFCGVGTWLPEKPKEKDMSYFGNPAMKFRRVSAGATARRGPEAASFLARAWHHFSTSIMDVFLYRGVQGATVAAAFCLGRWLCPLITEWWEIPALLSLYAFCSLSAWYLFSVIFGNLLFNGKVPKSNAYYSTAVTRWFTALTAQQRVFKLPFQTAGSRWQAPILRLLGAKIGRRFFCLNELVLVDAPFTEIGDDVTVDYDGQVRCHSFEDFRLKFTHFQIGNRVTIMAGASVAMCDADKGAVLRPGSVTWKGTRLAADSSYEGAPASQIDVETGEKGGPTLLGNLPRACKPQKGGFRKEPQTNV